MGEARRPSIPVSWVSPANASPARYAIIRGDKGQPTRSAMYGICPGKQTQHSSNLSCSNCFGRVYSERLTFTQTSQIRATAWVSDRFTSSRRNLRCRHTVTSGDWNGLWESWLVWISVVRRDQAIF